MRTGGPVFDMWFKSDIEGAPPYRRPQPWVLMSRPRFLGFVNPFLKFLPGTNVAVNIIEARIKWENYIQMNSGWNGDFPTMAQEQTKRVDMKAREVTAALMFGTSEGQGL